MAKTLQGAEVVITRPQPEGERLAKAIAEADGTPLLAPLVEIEDTPAVEKPPSRDLWIYVSRNAVRAACRQGHLPPTQATVLAIGPGTAEELHAFGVKVDAKAPPPYTSESLLSLSELQAVEGKQIVLVCGEGGRDCLMENLTKRGASVSRFEVYRRRPPKGETLKKLRSWLAAGEKLIVVTSGEILETLFRETQIAVHHPLFVVSPRLVEKARKRGFREVVRAASAREEDLLKALSEWWKQHGNTL